MRTKKVVILLSLMLVTSGFLFIGKATQTNTITFQGIGILADLNFPEEAHPSESIYHNLTITSQTYLSPINLTLYVYAPINSSWQLAGTPTQIILSYMNINQSFPWTIPIVLPQDTNGTLRCTIDARTNQTNYASFTFYTTQVHTLTYSELLANYTNLAEAYTQLNASYSALLIQNNILAENYSILLTDYATLLDSYNSLISDYIALNSTYNNLNSAFIVLNSTYYSLLANYTNLNSTYISLVAQISALQTSYDTLNSKYNALQTIQSDYNALTVNYNSLLNTKNVLQQNYTSLNSTHINLQATYNNLLMNYSQLIETKENLTRESAKLLADLNQKISEADTEKIVIVIFLVAVVGLITLIIYIKKKEPEPYMVIRKETVALKPDEEKGKKQPK